MKKLFAVVLASIVTFILAAISASQAQSLLELAGIITCITLFYGLSLFPVLIAWEMRRKDPRWHYALERVGVACLFNLTWFALGLSTQDAGSSMGVNIAINVVVVLYGIVDVIATQLTLGQPAYATARKGAR